jgi:hypothetical protein
MHATCQDALAPATARRRQQHVARRRHVLEYFVHAMMHSTFISVCWLTRSPLRSPCIDCALLLLVTARDSPKRCIALHSEPINPSEARIHKLHIQLCPFVCSRACPDEWSALMIWKIVMWEDDMKNDMTAARSDGAATLSAAPPASHPAALS